MKKYLIFLMLVSAQAYASNCKVTTVQIENNGKVQTETATVCKEGTTVEPKIKVGDVILASEVGKSKIEKVFNYRNSQCKMFTEHTAKNKELRVYHGVICQLSGSDTNWLVVDKW
jgi:ribosomal protein S4E